MIVGHKHVTREQMKEAIEAYPKNLLRDSRSESTGKMVFYVEHLGDPDLANVIAYYAEEGPAAGQFYLRADLVK